MVEMQIAYEGNLRTTIIHEPSGARLITDAPKDNQGEGQSFSPTDLVASALGSCMLTIMGIDARNFKIDITGATVRVQKEMVANPVRRIGKLTVEITVPTKTTQEQQRKLRKRRCTAPCIRVCIRTWKLRLHFHFGSGK